MGIWNVPYKRADRAKNIHALKQVRSFVLRKEISNQISLVDEISVVKGIFNRIIRQDQWDWFTVNMYMDYPSFEDLKFIVPTLANLRRALLQKDSLSIIHNIEHLKLFHFVQYCNNYLTFDINAETEAEYLYILSRREENDVLKIGMTTRNVQKRVNEINSATGVLYPYAARKVYRVKDCHKVEKDVHTLLADYRIRSDREFFKISFGKACSIIEQYLADSQQEFYGN